MITKTKIYVIVATLLSSFAANAETIFFDDFQNGASSLWGEEHGGWAVQNQRYTCPVLPIPTETFSGATATSLPFTLSEYTFEADFYDITDCGVWLDSRQVSGSYVGWTGVLFVMAYGSVYWHEAYGDGSQWGPMLGKIDNVFPCPGPNSGLGTFDTHVRITVETIGALRVYKAYLGESTEPVNWINLFQRDHPNGKVALYGSYNQYDNVTVSTVPEPSAYGLVIISIVSGLLFIRKPKISRTDRCS